VDGRMAAADLEAAWQSITAGADCTQRCVEQALQEVGVPAPWSPVLRLLLAADRHRLPMSTLARGAGMSPGGFSKLADRMARDGVIDRRSVADDRRVVHAVLTSDGLTLARRAQQAYRRALHDCVLSVLSADELRAASTLMQTLADAHRPIADAEENSWTTTQRDPVSPERRRQGHARS
jgi:DNA-binding MarR family transcriptional regulator